MISNLFVDECDIFEERIINCIVYILHGSERTINDTEHHCDFLLRYAFPDIVDRKITFISRARALSVAFRMGIPDYVINQTKKVPNFDTRWRLYIYMSKFEGIFTRMMYLEGCIIAPTISKK